MNLGGWCCPSSSRKAATLGIARGFCPASGSHDRQSGHTDPALLTRGVRPQPLTSLGFPHQQNRTRAPAGPFRENKTSITCSRAKVWDTSWPVTGTAKHQRPVRAPQTFQVPSALAPRGGRRGRAVVLHDADASPPVASSAHGASSPDPSRLSPQPPAA